MLQSAEEAKARIKTGQPILGYGWKEVQNFDDLDDLDEYESDEEEIYVVIDLGTGVDHKAMLAENTYQLIGLDAPVPFLKLGNQIYQGEVSPLIGDEIIFGRIRNEDKPHQPSRPPWHVTSHRLAFRPITIKPKEQAAAPGSETISPEGNKKETGTNGQARPAKNGLVTVTSAMTSALPPTKKASEVSRASSEVGPSRQSPEKGQVAQTQQEGETPAPSAKPRKESALHLRELTKLDEVMAITTIKIASTTRFRLSKELTDRFSIQTTPEHAISVQTTGYSQKDLLNMIQGKPLRGKGSRIPRGGKHDEASDGNLGSEGDDGESAKMGGSKGKAARGSGARGRAARGRGGGRGRGRGRGGKAGKGVVGEAGAEGEEDDRDDSSDGDAEVGDEQSGKGDDQVVAEEDDKGDVDME